MNHSDHSYLALFNCVDDPIAVREQLSDAFVVELRDFSA